MVKRVLLPMLIALAGGAVFADEGMWRLDQLPRDAIAARYGVHLTAQDLEKLHDAPVRILVGAGGGTGTFASANGLVLTNHHVALDCIRTSTLAEQNRGRADNLIEDGFTAASPAAELACKRFRVEIERASRDVTSEMTAGLTSDMDIAAVQRARQTKRSDLERACEQERGANYSCAVVDFNSGARSLLITYEDFNDVRLVYAPEKQLGYFGGDEMNFRFPRYVSDISILRVYVGSDGSHGEYDAAHVPYRPDHFLRVTLDGVKDGDFTMVAGNPGNTNRYRMSFSAVYNLKKGMPDRIHDMETELQILRRYAALKPEYQVLLQERIFGLANTLKYTQDVHTALARTTVVQDQQDRERAFTTFLRQHPDLQKEYGGVIDAQRAVYADDVEANADLDDALSWLQRPSTISYASGLYEFAIERAKPSDGERDPQFQERRWPDVRQSLLDDEPVIEPLDEDLLTIGFEKALALPATRRIAAVEELRARVGAQADARALARAVLQGSKIGSLDARKAVIAAPVAAFTASADPAIGFARALEPSLVDMRNRVRILNEKLFRDRAQFARGLALWKGEAMYPDANFTLRATYGHVAGYTDKEGHVVPYTTRFADMFALADRRGNTGDFALPKSLTAWRKNLGDAEFQAKYADLPVDFITTNDITGGNSGSATLDRQLRIVGLIFDGNEDSMASDWAYNGTTGRALSTDIRFALTLARDVHHAGWVVDELLAPDTPLATR
jgi:hypothetical protein